MAGIADAFTNAMYSPQETGWGMAASGAIGALPGLYNPYASTSKNFWVTAGGGIVAALLTGMARNQADKENAALYSGFERLQGAELGAREAIVAENPRLTNIAFALANDERATQRSIREKMSDNLIRTQGVGGYGQSLDTSGLAKYITTGVMPEGGFGANAQSSPSPLSVDVSGNSIEDIRGSEFLPETPEQFSERIKRAELAGGMSTPARAADFAKQEVKREYGDLSKLRANAAEEKKATAEAIAALTTMEQELPRLGNAGPLREALLNPTRVLASVSGDEKTKSELAARATYLSAAQSLTQDAVKGLAPVSNPDMQIAAASIGSLREGTTVPEAKAIIQRLKPLKENRLQYESEMSKWLNKYRTDKGFVEAYDQYKEEEPLFTSSGQLRDRPSFAKWFNSPKNKELKQDAKDLAKQDTTVGSSDAERRKALIESMNSMQFQLQGRR